MIVYGSSISPFVRKVLAFAAEKGIELELDQVLIHRMDSADSVFVRATFFEAGNAIPVVGSALVHDDVASAAVRALLHAVNRKLT